MSGLVNGYFKEGRYMNAWLPELGSASSSDQSGKEPSQRLSISQEKHLCDWVLAQAALGLLPTHLQLKEFASCILIAGSDL